MTRPIDKFFMKFMRSRDDVAAVLVLVAAFFLLAALVGFLYSSGFGVFSALFLGSLAFCALGALFAVTAPLWVLLLSATYILVLLIAVPFYSLIAQCRQTHKAS